MIIVDANIILRYMLDDHQELSLKASDIIDNNSVMLPIEVACEVVYVLQKVYSISRKQISLQISNLINQQLVVVEKKELLLQALECYSTTTFDFIDTLLWSYHIVEQHEIQTFDEKLLKYIAQI